MSRYTILITMPEGYDAHGALAGPVVGLEQIPRHLRRSITFDQVSEWALWPTLVDTYALVVSAIRTHLANAPSREPQPQWRWWFPGGTALITGLAVANVVVSLDLDH